MIRSFLRRRLVRRGLIAAGFFAILLLAAAWYAGGRLVAPANRAVGAPPDHLPFECVTLQTASGSPIAAWYLPAEDGRATVVLLHPIRATRRAMLTRAELFHREGHAVVLIDLPAHGESPGKHVTAGYCEREGVLPAIDFARRRNPAHRIVVVGWSLGGAAALMDSPLPIDAMVLESVYPSIGEAIDNRVKMRLGPLGCVASPLLRASLALRMGVRPSQLRPIDHIGSVGCPVLLLAGDADRHTTLAETMRMCEAAKDPKELAVFKDAGHVDLLAFDPDRYRKTVCDFLNRYLRSGKHSAI